ncbi:MAG: transporter substrate-binding domain-containing protein, partial [Oscillospiraceae bacterium]
MKKFMKSASMFLALAIVFSVLLIGCGKEKKTFTIGFDASFPPYGFRDDNGDYAGFDIDLAKEVAKRNG